MARTTADCKRFVVDFIQRNPQLFNVHWSPQDLINGDDGEFADIRLTLDEKNWKRMHRCKPGNSDYGLEEFQVYLDNQPTHSGYRGLQYVASTTMNADRFVIERGFNCSPFDGQFAHIILEDAQGNLYMGDYIGD